MKTKFWWGYIHTNGTIQVKRYYDDDMIDPIVDAKDSPSCKYIRPRPFEATSREDAIENMAKWAGNVKGK